MGNLNTIFLAIIFLFISLSIYAKHYSKKQLYIIFKPLTILLIIAFPLLGFREEYSPYAYLIITGLIFSLLGDLYLLFPDKYFTNGLYSFLIAHILYIIAFTQNVTNYNVLIILPIIIYIYVVVKKLYLKLGKMRYPVYGYILLISSMLVYALNFDYQSGQISFVGIGAILFTISDTTLAFNKFYKKFTNAELIILSSYFVAQLFFAMSI